jgi:hypothetical protein
VGVAERTEDGFDFYDRIEVLNVELEAERRGEGTGRPYCGKCAQVAGIEMIKKHHEIQRIRFEDLIMIERILNSLHPDMDPIGYG